MANIIVKHEFFLFRYKYIINYERSSTEVEPKLEKKHRIVTML